MMQSLSGVQENTLEIFYKNENKNPSIYEIRRIADTHSLSIATVSRWFTHRQILDEQLQSNMKRNFIVFL